eukprot:TRINITY_DN7093_c0_g1_i2.p1 TRINITY_DN7093_c0_g1~~TRINITY_DN7093_c0_g1_i2.p1  ORF type:complete len:582 (+),score=133.95 TRINITY_DN7093_c0_g1_i2:124-1869(+)
MRRPFLLLATLSFSLCAGVGTLLWTLQETVISPRPSMPTVRVFAETSLEAVVRPDTSPQPVVSANASLEAVVGAAVVSPKDELWHRIKTQQENILNSHQYCMLWCNKEDAFFKKNSTARHVYQSLSSDDEAEKMLGSYYSTEDREIYQSQAMNLLGRRCCQIATRESFEVIYDTRSTSNFDDDITLVTFGTHDRVEAMHETKKRWKGPVMLVLYVVDHNDLLYGQEGSELLTSTEQIQYVQEMLDTYKWDNLAVILYLGKFDAARDALRIGVNADYFNLTSARAYAQETPKLLSREAARDQGVVLMVDFPVNALRNVAQDFVETRFLISLDIDFIPNNDAYDFLRNQTALLGNEDKVGVVLPHFERRQCTWADGNYDYPQNFSELEEQLHAGLVRPFYCDINYWVKKHPDAFSWPNHVDKTNCVVNKSLELVHTVTNPMFAKGVRLSNYSRWFKESRKGQKAAKMYEIPVEALHSNQDLQEYEPYVMLDRVANSTHSLMRYNEVFVSRYRNKASWIFSLRLTGYKFFIATRHFLIHADHALSPWVAHPKRLPANEHSRLMFAAADEFISTLKNLRLTRQFD